MSTTPAQDTLFTLPEPSTPIVPRKVYGVCSKDGCENEAIYASPSGKSMYCKEHAKCRRNLHWITEFQLHPGLGIWVCPCVLEYGQQFKQRDLMADL